jgi:hypothetical protein
MDDKLWSFCYGSPFMMRYKWNRINNPVLGPRFGYGLLAFDSFCTAVDFMTRNASPVPNRNDGYGIYECAAVPLRLKPRLNTITNHPKYLLECDYGWPPGTIMVKDLKLRKLMCDLVWDYIGPDHKANYHIEMKDES